MRRFTLAVVGLAVGAGPLAAQHGHHQAPAAPVPSAQNAPAPMTMMPGLHPGDMPMSGTGMMAMDSMMSVMHRVHAFTPARILERADELGLTAEQRARVEGIRREAAPARDSAMAAAMAHWRELADALAAGTPAAGPVEAHFAATHSAMGAAHLADLRAAIAVMGVLTDLQRGRLGAAGAAPCPGCGTMPRAGAHQHDGPAASPPAAPRPER